MGPGRTLPALLRRWAKTDQSLPPTRTLGTLKDWSVKYGWAARAVAYEAAAEARRSAARERVFQRGLALDYARVRELIALATFLKDQLYEQGYNHDGEEVYHNVWVADVKQIGTGPAAERVDIERFNAPLIEQFRGALEDIAKETGGRVQKTQLTGDGGGPVEVLFTPAAVQAARAALGAPDADRDR